VTDPARGEFRGLGLGGQQLFIDREAQLVVAILSSTPLRIDPAAARSMDAALKALRDTLR
jgi:CubicO group peptidase (beta-lactamase class C family)